MAETLAKEIVEKDRNPAKTILTTPRGWCGHKNTTVSNVELGTAVKTLRDEFMQADSRTAPMDQAHMDAKIRELRKELDDEERRKPNLTFFNIKDPREVM